MASCCHSEANVRSFGRDSKTSELIGVPDEPESSFLVRRLAMFLIQGEGMPDVIPSHLCDIPENRSNADPPVQQLAVQTKKTKSLKPDIENTHGPPFTTGVGKMVREAGGLIGSERAGRYGGHG